MTDLHPNWDATDSGEQSIPVHVAATNDPLPDPPHVASMSRQPAAVAGILISVSIGFALYLGIGTGTHGGIASATTVRITSRGFSPAQISVTQGNEITWINDMKSAQALQSDEFCTQERQCFVSSLLAPGSSTSLTVTENFAPGTYRYYSISTQGLEGRITVIASDTPVRDSLSQNQANLENALPVDGAATGTGTDFASSASSVEEVVLGSAASSAVSIAESSASSTDPDPVIAPPEDPPVEISSSSSASEETAPLDIPSSDSSSSDSSETIEALPPESSSSSSSSSIEQAPSIPVNPYVVGTVRGSSNSKGTSGGTPDEILHGGAPRPLSQPETGPTVWIVIALALSALFALTQRSLSKKQI